MSVRTIVLTTLAAAAAWPAALPAQERQPFPRARIYINEDGPQVIRDRIRAITQRRARLGVTVDMHTSAADSIGATIASVTPGGPAAKAGIRSGDIITRINGKVLVTPDNTKIGEEDSPPGVRLVEYASQLRPNDTVTVEYRRGAAKQSTKLVTGDEPMFMVDGFGDMPGGAEFSLPRMQFEKIPSGGGAIEFGPGASGFAYAFGGGPLADLELAPLNPDLGQYFGTAEGVLVINVPRESTLGLKGGDVILTIDGRKAAGPGGLLRILRSYEPGDTFKFEIMRNKARTTVMGKMEKSRDE